MASKTPHLNVPISPALYKQIKALAAKHNDKLYVLVERLLSQAMPFTEMPQELPPKLRRKQKGAV